MAYLTMSRTTDQPIEVRYLPAGEEGSSFKVQVFLGSSFQSIYMSVEEARSFAESLLAVLPEPVEVAP